MVACAENTKIFFFLAHFRFSPRSDERSKKLKLGDAGTWSTFVVPFKTVVDKMRFELSAVKPAVPDEGADVAL